MIRDRREELLARLVEIGKTVWGAKNVYRNRPKLSAQLRPAIVILDGDEEGAAGDFALGRPLSRPSIMHLKPLICLMAGDNSDTIGSDLSALRLAMISAVLSDDQLQASVGQTGGVQYQGCSMDLGQGQTIEGTLILLFELHYPLLVQELT